MAIEMPFFVGMSMEIGRLFWMTIFLDDLFFLDVIFSDGHWEYLMAMEGETHDIIDFQSRAIGGYHRI